MSGWGTGWGNPWPTNEEWEKLKTETFDPRDYLQKPIIEEAAPITDEMWNSLKPSHIGIDLAKPGSDETAYGVWTAEGWKQLTEEQFKNNFQYIPFVRFDCDGILQKRFSERGIDHR